MSDASRIDCRSDHGPFDIIGDVHGCFDELAELLARLGYALRWEGAEPQVEAPEARRLIFVGDLVDRGPHIAEVLRLVMRAVQAGRARCVQGNHDRKLMRALRGESVTISHGLAESLAQLDRRPPEFRDEVASFIDSLPSHCVFDDGKLVVAHGGLEEALQGEDSAAARSFALFGKTTGERDEFGLPVRLNWALDYRGPALVVYGHTPVTEAQWVNNTINIDTGCVFGGKLTALRYPERTLVSVPARRVYYPSARPFLPGHAESPEEQSGQEAA